MTQSAIFEEGSPHTCHLEYRLPAGPSSAAACIQAIGNTAAPHDKDTHLVLAFGLDTWRVLSPNAIPEGLRSFEVIKGKNGHTAPATQGDIFLWIHGKKRDEVFLRAQALHRQLAAVAELTSECQGFEVRDSRDLIGFVDGTANPTADDRKAVAVIADGPCAGGSFVMTQKWAHNLTAFNALDVKEQEAIVGRTKPDSIELEGDAMPNDSHVSRTDVKIDGVAQKIYRRSTPFGSVSEHGLYFLAFACDIGRFDIQLRRMYGVVEDGIHDRLIEFSRAVSGAYWYAPTEAQLRTIHPG